MKYLRTIFRLPCWLFFCCLIGPVFRALAQQQMPVQQDTISSGPRLGPAALGLGLGYTGGLYLLSKVWYGQSPKTRFHLFNDNREWKQLDKAGHLLGAFHEGRLGIAALKAARVPEKKAIWYGGLLGFVLQSPIELLDGTGAGYGASLGDVGANALGALALISQELSWGEVRLMPAFSFHPSRWASARPETLGGNLPERVLKDYNGQTYWLSADIAAFLPAETKFPKWLNLAAGYGADNMVFGNPETNRQQGFEAYRQYYLAPDINFRYFKTRHKWLKGAFWLLDMVHLPMPAVEYNRRQGLKLHPIYF